MIKLTEKLPKFIIPEETQEQKIYWSKVFLENWGTDKIIKKHDSNSSI